MDVVFLGTGGTIPTEKRKHPALALRREGEVFLFDCGEGAQIQIFKMRVGIARIRAILISHLHGDHVLGIPGLLMTMTQSNRSQPLMIAGPAGIEAWIDHVRRDLNFSPSFRIAVQEAEPGPVFESMQFRIHAFPLRHGIHALGYCFQENERPGRFRVEEAIRLGIPKGPLWGRLQSGHNVKLDSCREIHPADVLTPARPGLKMVYAVDSRPCNETVEAAFQADLLVHDGMFLSEDLGKAQIRGHSTVTEAAEVAATAQVKRLALTHVSPRYRGQETRFLKQATKVFPKTVLAEDLMTLEIRHVDTRHHEGRGRLSDCVRSPY